MRWWFQYERNLQILKGIKAEIVQNPQVLICLYLGVVKVVNDSLNQLEIKGMDYGYIILYIFQLIYLSIFHTYNYIKLFCFLWRFISISFLMNIMILKILLSFACSQGKKVL